VLYVSRMLDLREASVAVLGAGAVGVGLAMELAARGVKRLVVLNRTYEKAVEVAKRVGGEARPLTEEEVEKCLAECDVVFSSVHTLQPVIKRVPPGARVKVIVDLGVPSSVAPNLPVTVVKIEDLKELAEEYNKERAGEVEKAWAIVEEEVARLPRLLARRYVEEATSAIMAQAMAAAEEEGRRAGCDTAVLAAKTTVKRTLLPLLAKLKEMAENGQAEEATKLIQLLQEAIAL